VQPIAAQIVPPLVAQKAVINEANLEAYGGTVSFPFEDDKIINAEESNC